MEQETKALDYEPLEGEAACLLDGKVCYAVEPYWEKGCESEANAELYWDQDSNAWLAIVSGKFLEGYERGEQVYLDFSHKPRALNQSACRKLLEAYGIPEGRFTLDEVSRMSPERLRQSFQAL